MVGRLIEKFDFKWIWTSSCLFKSENEFARGKCHVNGIENFWSFAKRRLSKFNGCTSKAFIVHLKECEFRYNHRNDDLLKIIKQIFKGC